MIIYNYLIVICIESNNDLKANSKRFIFDYSNGKYGYNIDDTFHAFSEGGSSPISSITYVSYTILASGWSSDVYGAIETTYPAASYNVFVCPVDTMTAEQFIAAGNAIMTGNGSSNTITALGGAPEIDIPVMLRVEQKAS